MRAWNRRVIHGALSRRLTLRPSTRASTAVGIRRRFFGFRSRRASRNSAATVVQSMWRGRTYTPGHSQHSVISRRFSRNNN